MSDSRFLPHLGHRPEIAPDAFVADTARLIGRVALRPKASVWYGCVLRGDINRIEIGEESNIQDGTVVHLEDEVPCIVGRQVVVGHMAMLHGTTIQDGSLIGIGAVLLTGSEIGSGSIIGAKALIPEGVKVPPNSLMLGIPAKRVRETTPAERKMIRDLALKYVRVHTEARKSLGQL